MHARTSTIVTLLACCLAVTAIRADSKEATFSNPILRGSYPDPSICREGDSWYLVNSSFEYYPGLPIHRSTDLVNWELVGYGLHRASQVTGALNLVDVQSDGGIHAPSIRCGNGRFYIITTNVYSPAEPGQPTEFVNFVITAERAEGPWSDPLVLDGAPGIDPDIFFDDDGRTWYVGTHSPENPDFPGEGEIWLQEIDTQSWALTGKRYFLWRGACGGTWAEGPHLYKHDNRYYLMVAEGGTSFNHAVMIAVSEDITGPYQSNPRNPILSSRHLSYDHWVNSTGHGDLFQLPDGRWYMVLLGIRGEVDRRSNMGRETHLVPVRWEREPFEWKDVRHTWPVAAPETGRVERLNAAPFPGRAQQLKHTFVDDFDGGALGLEWNFRRYPEPSTWSLAERPGFLRLHASAAVPANRGRASLVGVRQKESGFSYRAEMKFDPAGTGSEAGLMLFQKDDNYIAFTVLRDNDGPRIAVTLAEPGKPPEVAKGHVLADYRGNAVLQVRSQNHEYRFEYSLDGRQQLREFTRLGNEHLLSRGYTGAYLGLYATTNGRTHGDYADFDRVVYELSTER